MSKNIKINGQDMTKDEALEVIKDETKKITQLSVGFNNENPDRTSELTGEGFALEKALIAGLSAYMDECGASMGMLKFLGSRKIKGRNLYIVMADADDEINELLNDK